VCFALVKSSNGGRRKGRGAPNRSAPSLVVTSDTNGFDSGKSGGRYTGRGMPRGILPTHRASAHHADRDLTDPRARTLQAPSYFAHWFNFA
jgi:hypothetical protein